MKINVWHVNDDFLKSAGVVDVFHFAINKSDSLLRKFTCCCLIECVICEIHSTVDNKRV